MLRQRRVCLLVLAAAVSASGVWADDKAPVPVKVRGLLPPGYKKLGLTAEQVQEVYRIRLANRAKIDELLAKVEQLKKEEKAALDKVLTPAQKERLREIRLGDLPKATTPAGPVETGTNRPTAEKK